MDILPDPPCEPIRDAGPPRPSISQIWLHGYNDAIQLPRGVRLIEGPFQPGQTRKSRQFTENMTKDCFPGQSRKRPLYISEFLNTCAMMHAFTIPPKIDSITARKVLLSHDLETPNTENEKVWKLKANSCLYEALPTERSQRTIRLVTILPSQQKMADIKCILELQSLKRNPTYEALSYVWGNSLRLKRIDISGHAFYVNENLEVALRNLRFQRKPRILWIDAICINQSDTVEKSNQVMQMGEIYSQAVEVLIWLGPETNSSAKAFYYLRDVILPCIRILSERSAKDIDTWEGREGKLVVSSEFSDGFPPFALYDQKAQKFMEYTVQKEPESVQYLEGLCELLRRPWWRRIWVLQEVVRSKSAKLVCGTQTFPWTEFCHALGTIVNSCPSSRDVNISQNSRIIGVPETKTATGARNKLLRNIAAAFAGPMIMQNFRERWLTRSGTHLPLLLFATQRFKSTDPRDKIYALLGLINYDQDLDAIGIPDYDILPGILFTKVAKWLICRQQDLSLFEELHNVDYHFVGRVEDLSLPSWVPDFRFDRSIPPIDGHSWVFEEERGFYQWFLSAFGRGQGDSHKDSPENSERDERRPFCAGLEIKSPVPFRFSLDNRILTVIGVEVDTIVTVLESCLDDIGACVRGWRHEVLPDHDSKMSYVRGGTIKEAFWRTALANINIWEYQITSSATLIRDMIDGVSEMPPRSVDDEKNIVEGILAGTRGPFPGFRRRLFQTSSGLIGLGPETVEPGDVVTVLYGSRMCIILRPCQNSELYRVVGER